MRAVARVRRGVPVAGGRFAPKHRTEDAVELDPAAQLRSRISEAGARRTTPMRKVELALDESPEVRRTLAGNRWTPESLLTRLAADSDRGVKLAVIENLMVGTPAIDIASRDLDRDVRLAALRHWSISGAELERAADSSDQVVAFAVAGNWRCVPRHVLVALAGHEDQAVRIRAEGSIAAQGTRA